jgi:DNA-binding MarR family transcriptional regulator
MSHHYKFLQVLLPEIEAFLETKNHEDATLESFTLWMNHRILSKQNDMQQDHQPHLETFKRNIHGDIDGQITFLVLNLARHAKLYFKKVLSDTTLVGMDDFHFLAMLMHHESMKKTELIQANLFEMSSGIEVIKRLIKKNLIEDFDDPDDKRSKRVKVTSKGKDIVNKLMGEIHKVSQLLPGHLDKNQKITVLSLLIHLNDFHKRIFLHEKDKSLDELSKILEK